MPSCAIRPSHPSARRSAPAAATPRSTTAASTLRSSPTSSATAWSTVLARLRTNLAKIQGITLYMQAAQDITIGGRVSKTQYQYTLDDADAGELNHWAALFLDRIKSDPRHHRRRDRPAQFRSPARHHHQARGGFELRHPALHHRQHTRRRLRPAYRLDDVHDVEPVPCDHGGQSEIPVLAGGADRDLRQILDRPGSAAIDAGRQRGQGRPARGQPSGPVPVGDDLLQPVAGHVRSAKRPAPSSISNSNSASRCRCRPASRATPRPSGIRCRPRRS